MTARPATRTIVLTERRPTRCRLHSDDVAYLLAEQPARFAVSVPGRGSEVVVTPGGYAGTVLAPRTRIVVRPKVRWRDFLALMDVDLPADTGEHSAADRDWPAFVNVLARHLAGLLEERTSVGLCRDYVERAVQGPVLQGRLDMAAQARAAVGRRDRLCSLAEDLTADVRCNQIAKAVAEQLAACPLIADGARARLRAALRGFEGVIPILPPSSSFADAIPRGDPERERAYGRLLRVCRVVAEALAPAARGETSKFPAFLVSTERVFEQFVADAMTAALACGGGVTVRPQERYGLARGTRLFVRPDVTVERCGRPWLVVDAKWRCGAARERELYQALAYAAALGVRRAALVYPGARPARRRIGLVRSRVVVDVCRVAVRRVADVRGRAAAQLRRVLAPRLAAQGEHQVGEQT